MGNVRKKSHYNPVVQNPYQNDLTGVGSTVGVKNINNSDLVFVLRFALKSQPSPGTSLSTGTPETSSPSLSLIIPPITTVSPLLTIRVVLMDFLLSLLVDGA
jgi:hypothetical protein